MKWFAAAVGHALHCNLHPQSKLQNGSYGIAPAPTDPLSPDFSVPSRLGIILILSIWLLYLSEQFAFLSGHTTTALFRYRCGSAVGFRSKFSTDWLMDVIPMFKVRICLCFTRSRMNWAISASTSTVFSNLATKSADCNTSLQVTRSFIRNDTDDLEISYGKVGSNNSCLNLIEVLKG